MKFSEIPYSRPDLVAVLEQYDALLRRFREAESAQVQMECFREREQLESHFYTMATICEIRNSVDTRDAFYEKEKEFFNDNGPSVDEKRTEFYKAMLASPFRKELEEELGSLVFSNMETHIKSFSPEIIPLLQEENRLMTQYQKLYASAQVECQGTVCTIAQLTPFKQHPDPAVRREAFLAEGRFFDQHREEFDQIYDQMVKNRTEQAHRLGFKNFVELGYVRQNRNCYGLKDVAEFRRRLLRDWVPVVSSIKEDQRRRINGPVPGKMKFYDDTFLFPDGNPVPQGSTQDILEAGRKIYTEMSPETAEFIKVLFDMELFDVESKEGKAPGGYCAGLPDYQYPYIFSNFNGTAGDVEVLTHEAGHAFAFYLMAKEIPCHALRENTAEVAETHSMAMEYLTAPWHSLFFGPQTQKYEQAHTENALSFVLYGTEVDLFQEIIYSNPDMTPEERNQTWMEIDRQFRPYLDYEDLPFYSRGAGWQEKLHFYMCPFYYLEYCMAGIAALEFWALSLENWQDAWDRYVAFVRQGGKKTFTGLLKASGMQSPLDEGCLKHVAETAKAWLDQHKD